MAMALAGACPLTAGLCPAAGVTLKTEPMPPAIVPPGGTVNYHVKYSVSAGGREVTDFTEDPNTGNASFTVPGLRLTNDAPKDSPSRPPMAKGLGQLGGHPVRWTAMA